MKTVFNVLLLILYFTNYEFEFIEIVVVSAAFNVFFFVTKAVLKKETKKEEYYQYKKAE